MRSTAHDRPIATTTTNSSDCGKSTLPDSADGLSVKIPHCCAGKEDGIGEANSSHGNGETVDMVTVQHDSTLNSDSSSFNMASSLPPVSPKLPCSGSATRLISSAICTLVLLSPPGAVLSGGRITPTVGDRPRAPNNTVRAVATTAVDSSTTESTNTPVVCKPKPPVIVPVPPFPGEPNQKDDINNSRSSPCSSRGSTNIISPPSIPQPQRLSIGLASSTPVTASIRFSPATLRRRTGTPKGPMASTAENSPVTAAVAPVVPQTTHYMRTQRFSFADKSAPASLVAGTLVDGCRTTSTMKRSPLASHSTTSTALPFNRLSRVSPWMRAPPRKIAVTALVGGVNGEVDRTIRRTGSTGTPTPTRKPTPAAAPSHTLPTLMSPLPSWPPVPTTAAPSPRNSSQLQESLQLELVALPHHSAVPNSQSSTELSSTKTAAPLEPSTTSPHSAEMPNWMAHLKTALLSLSTPACGTDCIEDGAGRADMPNSFLVQHRTFSSPDSSSADDWLNPCQRPDASETRALLGTCSRPPLVACPGPHHPLGDDGKSGQPRMTQTLHVTLHGNNTIENDNCKTDTAVDRSSGDVLTLWSSNRGHATNRGPTSPAQYPCLNVGTSGSTSPTMAPSDSIPTIRDSLALTPQPQRFKPDSCPSLYSGNVAESEVTQDVGGSDRDDATAGDDSSTTAGNRGTVDVINPVRLRHRANGCDSSINLRDALVTAAPPLAALHGRHRSPFGHPFLGMAAAASSAAVTTAETTTIITTIEAPPSGEMSHRLLGNRASPRHLAPPTNSTHGSALSLLSNSDGPSPMNLPLARFFRNSSSSGMGNAAATHFYPPPIARPSGRPLSPQLRQQHATGVASQPNTVRNASTRYGAPYVLSLALNTPPVDPYEMVSLWSRREDEADAEVQPLPWLISALSSSSSTPHKHQPKTPPLHSCGIGNFTQQDSRETSLGQVDPLAYASGTTSGVSLATETQFVHYRKAF